MFKKVMSMVLGFFNVESFEKNSDGKMVLTDQQKKDLASEYGQQFADKFEKDLEAHQEPGATKDPFQVRMEQRMSDLETTNQNLAKTNKELKEKVNILSKEPEPFPVPQVVNEGGKETTIFSPNKSYMHNTLAEQFLGGDQAVLAAGESIDVTDVATEWPELINYVKLPMLNQIFREFEIAKHLTWKRAITSWKATKSIITSVIQQFVPKWTPLSQTKFTPIEIPLRRFKINVEITPADVEDWIFAMYDESIDITQMPITKYVIDQKIKPQAQEDLANISALGVFDELVWADVNDGDPGQDPMKAMDGFITLLKQDLAKGANKVMSYIDIGVSLITEENILTVMKTFVDNIDEKFRNKQMPIFIDPDLYKMYKRAYKDKYGNDSADPQFGSDTIDFSKQRLVPIVAMTATGSFFCTPKQNFIGLRHKNEPGATRLTVHKASVYTVHIAGEFRFGLGFAAGEAVFYWTPEESQSSGSIV